MATAYYSNMMKNFLYKIIATYRFNTKLKLSSLYIAVIQATNHTCGMWDKVWNRQNVSRKVGTLLETDKDNCIRIFLQYSAEECTAKIIM